MSRLSDRDLARDSLHAALPAIKDDLVHQLAAQPLVVEVGADDDGEFGFLARIVRNGADDAEGLMAAVFGLGAGDEGHFPGVVDAGEAPHFFRAQVLDGAEEPEADILAGQVMYKVGMFRFVLAPDGTQDDGAPGAQGEGFLQAGGIGGCFLLA